MSQSLSAHGNFNKTRWFFYIATLCMWVSLINLPKQQIKAYRLRNFTNNRLAEHGDKKANSATDSITAIYSNSIV